MTKKRIYGLDLLRILSMLGIIGLHVVNNGGFMDAATSATQAAIVRVFATVCYCSVNVFAMLTGFLYIEKAKIRSSNLIDLLTTVEFYCISILALFLCLMPTTFTHSPSLVIFSLFPPLKGRYWFITSYDDDSVRQRHDSYIDAAAVSENVADPVRIALHRADVWTSGLL